MLFPGRTDIHSVAEAIVVWPHHKAVNTEYFCSNLSCLSDILLARRTSSFRNVWLVTEETTNCTWLMMAKTPSCPHCDSLLCAVIEEKQAKKTVNLPLM